MAGQGLVLVQVQLLLPALVLSSVGQAMFQFSWKMTGKGPGLSLRCRVLAQHAGGPEVSPSTDKSSVVVHACISGRKGRSYMEFSKNCKGKWQAKWAWGKKTITAIIHQAITRRWPPSERPVHFPQLPRLHVHYV